uniref:COesterase domain-containing protein n=1 Tax=Meloidogyne hapla TaxID=6305 RepID=A0A1I8B3T3_MELHA
MINKSFTKFVKGIPSNDEYWCERMAEGNLDYEERKKLEEWKFTDEDKTFINEESKDGEDINQRCTLLKENFLFNDEPLSEEERLYPLAYGLVVYKSAFQVYMMMSAIYHASVGPVGWCEYGVARAVYNCLFYLTKHEHNWKYFQNICPPLTLWKSSMSSLFPREAANEMIASPKVHELMRFLQHTSCSDEAIWATVAGNPQELKISGGFNAAAFFYERMECVKNKKGSVHENIEAELKLMAERHPNEPFLPDNYYISRYQVWGDSNLHKCYGKFVSGSCVYGINDIPILLKRPELVQHKMYLSYQPAGD